MICTICILIFCDYQGALDGGLDVPHSEKRFPGFSKEDKSLNAETHRKYILGGHIADYMRVSNLQSAGHDFEG